MKEYAIWAAEQIMTDYPMLPFDLCMQIVTETTICKVIKRYSIEVYLEGKNG